MKYDVIVIGAGAAGFFAAIHAKQAQSNLRVAIVEKSLSVLSKVKISGGGRCNVTNGCQDPSLLVKNYPRGEKELLGPFHRFGPKQTVEWFEKHGVELKQENDGRVFPITDSSQTIIDCLIRLVKELQVELLLKRKIQTIEKKDDEFHLLTEGSDSLIASKLIIATGSSLEGHKFAKELGHTIIDPIPSLFTFNVPTSPLKELSGVAIPEAFVKIPNTKFSQTGPLLITHFGFSGPCILKLSAKAARYFAENHYHLKIEINWLNNETQETVYRFLLDFKKQHANKLLGACCLFSLPKRLWEFKAGDLALKKWNDCSAKELESFASLLTMDSYEVEGKTTHKEEFVTCGGVSLKEVDFKTMESKLCPGLYFAGEVLDVDAVTGGFNFQNAWTTGFIAGSNAAK